MSSPSLLASGAPRLHGLDTLRAAAILLVFAYHYQVFVSGAPTFGWLSRIGWAGVDLFFVLSGYLIANQLMGGIARGERLSLPRFYGRRLLRTLPNFYVVLALYLLLPQLMGGREPPPLWRFLTFTQNIGLAPGTAFSHAWSLCIEEQFYLMLPAALMLGAALKSRRRVLAWSLIAGLTLAAIAWRDHLWRRYGTQDPSLGYYPQLYYGSLSRLDEFLPGVAIALLKHGHADLWAALMRRSRMLLVVGVAASLGMLTLMLHFYYIDGHGYGHAMSSWGYSALAWSFGLLTLAALAPRGALSRVEAPGALGRAELRRPVVGARHALARHVGIELERQPDELDPGLAGDQRQGLLEAALADVAPRTDDVRGDLDLEGLHGGYFLPRGGTVQR